MEVMVVPDEVVRAGLPVEALVGEGAGQAAHADGGDPLLRAGACDDDVVSDGEACGGFDGEEAGAGGYGFVGNLNGVGEPGIRATACFDEGAAIVPLGDDGGAAGSGAAAAQYYSADVQTKLAGDEEAAGAEQDGSAEAVRVERQGGHVVDRGLQEEGVVLAGGAYGDNCSDCWYRLAGLVAGEGEVDGRMLRVGGERVDRGE